MVNYQHLKLFHTSNNFQLPKTAGSVGYDVVATDMIIDFEKEIVIYDTDLAFYIDEQDINNQEINTLNFFIALVPRSSIYKKKHICCLANHFGVVDLDYTNYVKFIFRLKINELEKEVYKDNPQMLDIYRIGDRIGQALFIPVLTFSESNIYKVDKKELEKMAEEKFRKISDNIRMNKGFGSTGN